MDFALLRGSKQGNRCNNANVSKAELSSLSLFLSLPLTPMHSVSRSLSVSREPHAHVFAVWYDVVRCGAMWPRLDSIRVAAADRCVAMTTLPPPVIQLPPRTPLPQPPPPPSPPPPPLPSPNAIRALLLPQHRRYPPDEWVAEWVPTHRAVCYRHCDRQPPWSSPRSGSVPRDIATMRSSTLRSTSFDPNRHLPEIDARHLLSNNKISFLAMSTSSNRNSGFYCLCNTFFCE